MAARVAEIISIERQYLPNTPVSVFDDACLDLKVPSFDPDYVAKVHAKRPGRGLRRRGIRRRRRLRLGGPWQRLVRRHVHGVTGTAAELQLARQGLGGLPVRVLGRDGKVTLTSPGLRLRRQHGGVVTSIAPGPTTTAAAGLRGGGRGGPPHLNGTKWRPVPSCLTRAHSYEGGAHADIVGKSHIIQVTNIGYDVSGDHPTYRSRAPGIFDTGDGAVRERPAKARRDRKTSTVATTTAAATI